MNIWKRRMNNLFLLDFSRENPVSIELDDINITLFKADSFRIQDIRNLSTGIAEKQVTVWLLGLTKIDKSNLSEEETAKSRSFMLRENEDNYVFAHVVLRELLAHYLGVNPSDVRISTGINGKPDPVHHGSKRIEYSISYSHERFIYAFSPNRQLGIDIEHVRPLPNLESLALRLFNEDFGLFRQIPSQRERLLLYYQGWTFREAYFKVFGGIISDYSVHINNRTDRARVEIRNGESGMSRMDAILRTEEDYVVSLVVK
jgi:phosphopantetheinyl transferase